MTVYMLGDMDLGSSGAPITHFTGLMRGFATIHQQVVAIVRHAPNEGFLGGFDPDRVAVHEVPVPTAKGLRHVLFELRAHKRLKEVATSGWPENPVGQSFLYERFGTVSGLGPMTAKQLGIPYVAEFNGLTGQELLLSGHRRTAAVLGDWTDKWQFKNCDVAVCVTEGIRDALIRNTGRQWNGALVIHNAVDPEILRPQEKPASRASLAWPCEKLIVGFVGSLAAWQGLSELIEAASRLPRPVVDMLEIRVVGDGCDRAALEYLADTSGLSHAVRFEGHVPWDHVVRMIPAFDIGFLNRTGLEGGFTPIKLFEYMACEVPCLARNVPGISNVINESGAGILFSSQDELVEILSSLVSKRAELANMGKAGRRYIENGHTWTDVAVKVTDAVVSISDSVP